MTYGLQCTNAAGQVTFDSTLAAFGCLVDRIALAASAAAQVRTYPDFAGRGVVVMTLAGAPGLGVTADTALGYPRVSVPASDFGGELFLVFVT